MCDGGVYVENGYIEAAASEEESVQRAKVSVRPPDQPAHCLTDVLVYVCVVCRGVASDVLLNSYSSYITSSSSSPHTGALLTAVINGTLSEGINFSDSLCRCVCVVGLPYPNANDQELQEKIKFSEKKVKDGGRVYYESLCMRAVNQSIGRAIRHKNDYSSIVLIDHRYSKQSVRDGVSKWLRESIKTHPKFPTAFQQLRSFFHGKKVKH